MQMMEAYWPEFVVFAIANWLSLISPGPDFLMVVRSSLRYDRKTALWVSFGVSCGELTHVTYSLLGIGLLIMQSVWAFTVFKYLGAAYLVYVGLNSLRARKEEPKLLVDAERAEHKLSAGRAFVMGFLTNALNAKAAFFTFSFFAVLVSPQTPLAVQIFYGLFIQLSTLLWFSVVSTILTNADVQARFFGMKHWIERVAGAILMILGFRLAWF